MTTTTDGPATRTVLTYGVLGPVALTCAAIVVIYVTGLTIGGFWYMCQTANIYLSVLAAVGVCARLVMMLLDRGRWHDYQGLHLIAWFVYIILALINVSVGAVYYDLLEVPPSWPSGMRTLLNLMAISLCIWWPHPRRLTHIEETHRARA